MADRPETTVSFRTLHASPLVSVRSYDCHACRSGPGPEETSTDDTIVLMRAGAFRRHFGTRSVTADVNQTAFFAKGSVYRVSHPVDRGDRGTSLLLSPRVLREIVAELAPEVGDRTGSLLPFACGPCNANVFQRHRELVRNLVAPRRQPPEPLWVEVAALQLAADVLEAAFARYGSLPQKGRRRTVSSHAELTDAAVAYLVGHLGTRVTLDDVAGAVNASPFHLARVFQGRTGVSLHRYLTLLRLRAALDRLADGEDDLTSLALDLGFSSHSHFSDAFRREFGHPPSQARRAALAATSRKTSKDPKA